MHIESGRQGRRDRHDPLAGIGRLLVDGTNLLHALRRAADPPPQATLIGRLRAITPPGVRIVLVFDGREAGVGTSRLASGLTVRHSGRESADRLIERLAAEEPSLTLVVTDDRELGRAVREAGATSTTNAWLVRRLARARVASPSVGSRRPAGEGFEAEGAPRAPASHPAATPAEPGLDPDRDHAAALDAARWRPGRGSTRKRGNPHRGRPPA